MILILIVIILFNWKIDIIINQGLLPINQSFKSIKKTIAPKRDKQILNQTVQKQKKIAVKNI